MPAPDLLKQLGLLEEWPPERIDELRALLKPLPPEQHAHRLLEEGVEESVLARGLSSAFQLKRVAPEQLLQLQVSAENLSLLPAAFLREHGVLPTFMDRESSTLSIIIWNPLDLQHLTEVQQLSAARKLRPFIAERSSLLEALDRLLPEEEEEDFQDEDSPRAKRALVLEPRDEIRRSLQMIERSERAGASFVELPSQVAEFLSTGRFDRLLYQVNDASITHEDLELWKREFPEIAIHGVQGFSPARIPLISHQDARGFLLKVLEFMMLSGEGKNMLMRSTIRRITDLTRELCRVLQLPQSLRDLAMIGALFVRLDKLSLVSGLIGDNSIRQDGHRFELALAVLNPLSPPYDLDAFFSALEERLLHPQTPSHDRCVEVVYTAMQAAEHSSLGEALLREVEAKGRYQREVLQALGSILRRETLMGRLAHGEHHEGGASVILLAEREPSLVTAVETRLRQFGYLVVSVVDGEAALQKTRELRPLAVIAGLRLPRRDGLSLLHELKRDSELAETPVFLISDRPSGADLARGLELGAEDVLSKPLNLRALVLKLQRVIESKNLPQAQGVVGRLTDMGLPDLIQTLTMGGKTAEIQVTGSTGIGHIWVDSGQLVASSFLHHRGEEALFHSLSLQEGLFEVRFSSSLPAPNIHRPTQTVLLDILRRIDEARRAKQSSF